MEEIKLSEKVREKLRGFLAQRGAIETALTSYVQGIVDINDGEGNWSLDTNKWVLIKMPEPESKEQ